jgi:hypothetical protein
MVNKITGFTKGKGKKGNFKKNGKTVAAPVKKPKVEPKPETKCSHYKGKYHWERNFLKLTGR